MAAILKINIAYVLPAKVAQEFISVSKKISKQQEVYFVLDQQHIPHFSLYQLYLPAKNWQKLISTLAQICAAEPVCKFHFVHNYYGRGYLGLDFEISKQIRDFHELIIKKINYLREGLHKQKYVKGNAEFDGLTKSQQENIKLYGYPNAKSEYHPHITLTRCKSEAAAAELARNFNYKPADFTCQEIAIFEMGEHGTCKTVLKKFNLKN